MTENELSKIVVNCAYKVHKSLGPGLLESAYEECLFYELNKTDLKIEKQKALPLMRCALHRFSMSDTPTPTDVKPHHTIIADVPNTP